MMNAILCHFSDDCHSVECECATSAVDVTTSLAFIN